MSHAKARFAPAPAADAVHGTDDGFLQLANGANHGVVAVANDVAQVGHLAIARRRFGEVLSGTKALGRHP
jgi:hypothetical protein